MQDEKSIQEKIRALSLKTMKNGATAAEESAAKTMIIKLSGKTVLPKPPSKEKNIPEVVELFLKYKSEGILSGMIDNLNWDKIAENILETEDYHQYLYDTHGKWNDYQMTRNSIKIVGQKYVPTTLVEYNRSCYIAFSKLYNERKKNDHN